MPKRKPFKLSSRALKQLDEIYTYTLDHWSEEQAESYNEILMNGFQFIDDHFEIGRKLNTEHDEVSISVEHRIHTIGKHYVVYKKNKSGQTVIVQVIHFKRDINSLLYG